MMAKARRQKTERRRNDPPDPKDVIDITNDTDDEDEQPKQQPKKRRQRRKGERPAKSTKASVSNILQDNGNKGCGKEDDDIEKECPICSEILDTDDNNAFVVSIQSCNHRFHEKCLQDWLDRDQSCPICRTKICNTDSKQLAVLIDD